MTSNDSLNLDDFGISQNWGDLYAYVSTPAVATGINIIDRHTLGLSGITCIRGQPKTNKSTLCLQISNYYAKNHGPVVFLDRENGANRLRHRLLCQELESDSTTIKLLLKNKKIPQETEKILQKLPFYIVPTATFGQCEDLINQALEKHKKPVLFVLDSLNKVRMNLNERRASIDEWLCNIDELKVKYEQDLRTIFTSEKNYQGYASPALGGSKDSSEIEYTAESIWDLRLNQNPKQILFHVTADRDGPANYEFPLEKVFSDPNNARSFCYKLKEAETNFDFSV